MRKIIIEEWMSLDGCVTDQDGTLNFFTSLTQEQNRYADENQLKFLETIDTILLGRKTYELFVDFWPTAASASEIIADRLNSLHKVVFSNTLTKAPWGNWEEAEVVAGNAVPFIRNMKSLPGKDIVIWGSISLAQGLIKENLVDEYHLQLCPAITGGGRRLFPEPMNHTDLQLTEFRKYDTGSIFLNYKPV